MALPLRVVALALDGQAAVGVAVPDASVAMPGDHEVPVRVDRGLVKRP